MSLRPEIELLKALLPHRNINFDQTITEGENTMDSNKSLLLRLAEQRERRLQTRAPWPKRAAVVGVALTATVGSGVAFAAWSASGTGSGSAKAATVSPLSTVSATASTTSLLYPGGSADLKVTFDNPNPFAVKITSVSANGAVTVAAAGTGTCTTTGVSLSAQTGLSLVVPARSNGTDGQLPATLTGAVSMDSTSDSGCQGATFSVPVTFSGTSN